MIEWEAFDGTQVISDLEWVTVNDERIMLATASDAGRLQLTAQFTALRAAEAMMTSLVTPLQSAITYGDHWVRYYRNPDGPVTIYGKVLPLAAIREVERAAGSTERELNQLMAHLHDGYERGWRHCLCFSQVVPEGETGGQHVAMLTRISGELFRQARRNGWPPRLPGPAASPTADPAAGSPPREGTGRMGVPGREDPAGSGPGG